MKTTNLHTLILALILGLVGYLAFRLAAIESRLKRTNTFIYEALHNDRIDHLNAVHPTDIVLGDEEAPNTIILYTRLTCDYCDDFFKNTFPEIRDKLLETGKAKFILRYLPDLSDSTELASVRYAYCLDQADLFEPFLNTSIKNPDTLVSLKSLQAWSGDAGADTTRLQRCSEDPEITDLIRRNALLARKAGISATPYFIINGHELKGNRKFVKFEEILRSE